MPPATCTIQTIMCDAWNGYVLTDGGLSPPPDGGTGESGLARKVLQAIKREEVHLGWEKHFDATRRRGNPYQESQRAAKRRTQSARRLMKDVAIHFGDTALRPVTDRLARAVGDAGVALQGIGVSPLPAQLLAQAIRVGGLSVPEAFRKRLVAAGRYRELAGGAVDLGPRWDGEWKLIAQRPGANEDPIKIGGFETAFSTFYFHFRASWR